MESSSITTLIFAKYPETGKVMTRLCPPLSHEQAAAVQEACLIHVVVHAAARCEKVVLVGAPDDCLEQFELLFASQMEYWPQGEGDLGERLTRSCRRAFDEGAGGVVIIGADSPTMDWSLMDRMPHHLSNADVAIGPSEDGGYYVLAIRDCFAELFEGIDWGTDQVFDQTVKKARAVGLRVKELKLGYDVDRIADLERAITDFAGQGFFDISERLRAIVGGETPN